MNIGSAKRSVRLHLSEGDLRCSVAVIFNPNGKGKFGLTIPLDSSVYIWAERVTDKAYNN